MALVLIAAGAVIYGIVVSSNNTTIANAKAYQEAQKNGDNLEYPVEFSRRPLDLFTEPKDFIVNVNMPVGHGAKLVTEDSYMGVDPNGVPFYGVMVDNSITKLYRHPSLFNL